MYIYLVYFSLLALLTGANYFFSSILKRKKFLFFLLSFFPILLLYLLSVLKKNSVGTDTISYLSWYDDLLNKNEPSANFYDIEIGFRTLMIVFANAGLSFRIFQSFVYLLIYVPVWFVIYKKSSNPPLSIFIYCCWSFMVFNFSGLRQAVAMSLCLLAFVFLLKKKVWSLLLFFIIVCISASFHISSIVFLATALLLFVQIKPSALPFLIPLLIIFFFFAPSLFQLLYYALDLTIYPPTYREGAGEYYFLFLLMFIFSNIFLFDNEVKQKITNSFNRIFKNVDDHSLRCTRDSQCLVFSRNACSLFLFGALFQTTSIVNYSFPRLGMQFLQFAIFIIPEAIYAQRNKHLQILSIIFVLICFALFFVWDSVIPDYLNFLHYEFFWQ